MENLRSACEVFTLITQLCRRQQLQDRPLARCDSEGISSYSSRISTSFRAVYVKVSVMQVENLPDSLLINFVNFKAPNWLPFLHRLNILDRIIS
jgi:hypothetical protein